MDDLRTDRAAGVRFRKLRIAWSVGCSVLCLLLIVLWVRSYHQQAYSMGEWLLVSEWWDVRFSWNMESAPGLQGFDLRSTGRASGTHTKIVALVR
jgi:hypothetical protein